MLGRPLVLPKQETWGEPSAAHPSRCVVYTI